MLVQFSDGTREEYEEQKFTSGGAQGDIYRSHDGRSVLKRYKSAQFQHSKLVEMQNRLDKLIYEYNPTRGYPYWRGFFAWPEKRAIGATTASGKQETFVGYRMPLVSDMTTLDHYIFASAFARLPPEKKGSLRGFLACALQIASAAHCLAHMGLCFADFSERNVLVNPVSGRAVLIDCDSLTVPDALAAVVLGTGVYCAPEIVTRTATVPSIHTDRHALAVLFYYLLLGGHPLEGPNKQKYEESYYLGEHPLYIENPVDTSNAMPQQRVKAVHLGPDIQRLFSAAFVDGLAHPDRRPLPADWMEAFRRAYDQLIPCQKPSCRWHFFVARPRAALICPMCGSSHQEPATLPFLSLLRPHQVALQGMAIHNAPYIVGWPERELRAWHIAQEKQSLFGGTPYLPDSTAYALFLYDRRSRQWFLKNLALSSLTYTKSSRRQNWIPCPLNETIPLTDDLCLHFGDTPEHYFARVVLERSAR